MTDASKILVALGASAAANCRPCMDHHIARARKAALPESDVRVALEVGIKVSQGAQAKTRDYIGGLLEGSEAGGPKESTSCC